MWQQIEQILLAIAAVFDGVLLVILLERVNSSQVSIWLKWLLIGSLIAHCASFLQAAVPGVDGQSFAMLNQACMFAMCAGLLLLPSAMLHGAIRLNHTGSIARPKMDFRYLGLYFPILSLPWAGSLVFSGDGSDFLRSVAPMKWPYIAWVSMANLTSMGLFLRARRQLQIPGTNSFFAWLSISLIAMTTLAIIYVAWGSGTPWRKALRLATILSPILPAFLFVWYSLRQQLLALVMERTLVYGAIFVGLLWLHRITVRPLIDRAQSRSPVDLVLLELAVVAGIILAWRPLRRRVGEALRYLLSSNVFQVRDATRQLSVDLSRMSALSPSELIESFCAAVQVAIAVQSVRIELCEANPVVDSAIQESPDLRVIFDALEKQGASVFARGRFVSSTVFDALDRLGAMWAFRLRFGGVRGAVLLGPRKRCDRLADEQLTALGLLFEQFAATLHNRKLDAQRMRAERQAMQQEKLSVLGLMAGSLAHELRNPLSSIRTIATLMLEEPAASSSMQQDLAVIVAEIDRLTATTQRLLDYARPADVACQTVQPDRVVERLLHILGHFAGQHHVSITTSLNARDTTIASTDATLSEILFNLIRNAIEAASESPPGSVNIKTEIIGRSLVLTVADNGPGIVPEVRKSLFQPFVTGKIAGTGLGLYVAAERVRELDGSLGCESEPGRGTIFEVKFRCSSPSQRR